MKTNTQTPLWGYSNICTETNFNKNGYVSLFTSGQAMYQHLNKIIGGNHAITITTKNCS